MATRNSPSALEPYLRLPPETSLILLTSTLGCSVNWLAARHVSETLSLGTTGDAGHEQTAVVLVSWLRDLAFWKTEIRRGTGLDISRVSTTGRFVFVDCFSQARSLAEIEKLITGVIPAGDQRRLLLVLDSPDISLATGVATSHELNHLLLKLRSLVHATAVTCSADLPLVCAAVSSAEAGPTPIEAETAAFASTQAHAARLIMSVRELDTGAARDVSGVLRITKGGNLYGFEVEHDEIKEAELLYLVQRDGNVKVFNRGTDAV